MVLPAIVYLRVLVVFKNPGKIPEGGIVKNGLSLRDENRIDTALEHGVLEPFQIHSVGFPEKHPILLISCSCSAHGTQAFDLLQSISAEHKLRIAHLQLPGGSMSLAPNSQFHGVIKKRGNCDPVHLVLGAHKTEKFKSIVTFDSYICHEVWTHHIGVKEMLRTIPCVVVRLQQLFAEPKTVRVIPIFHAAKHDRDFFYHVPTGELTKPVSEEACESGV